jgi:hypothetical protein
MTRILTAVLILVSIQYLSADPKPKNYLQTCWNKQVMPLQSQYLSFSFQETKNNFDHGTEPFQVRNYSAKGKLSINAENFIKKDTMTSGQRVYYSKTRWSTSELLFLDYGDEKLFESTIDMQKDLLFQNARYAPINMIDYFLKQKVELSSESTKELAVYVLAINGSQVRLFIRKSDNLMEKITILCKTDFINDELFGDILTVITYRDYAIVNAVAYASTITVEKMDGKLKEEIQLTSAQLSAKAETLLEKPEGYKLTEKPEIEPEAIVEKYSNNIYFVQLPQTDDRSLIVEFKDFMAIAEAPLNSAYGELVIAEAKKIAPNKPIKYFVFGHFHTHYIGGVRAFVHKDATILAQRNDMSYVQFIVNAPHTLNPDNLQREPKPLKTEEISDSKTITDGTFEMKIFYIGDKSQHTNDYMIYYFPTEQLVFEDDLVWIARQGEIKKAGTRQAGLYNAIKELGLNVKTVVQSWPVKDYGVKTVIPFADLEESMK